MNHSLVQLRMYERSQRQRDVRWWPLVAVTSANYLWQVPYAVHQYGHRWDALAGLSIPLILTGFWFAAAVAATLGGRRGGRVALAAFLVTEFAFYVVHNVSGAFGADLPLKNPVVLIASLLGYASIAVAGVYLVMMARRKHGAQTPREVRATRLGRPATPSPRRA